MSDRDYRGYIRGSGLTVSWSVWLEGNPDVEKVTFEEAVRLRHGAKWEDILRARDGAAKETPKPDNDEAPPSAKAAENPAPVELSASLDEKTAEALRLDVAEAGEPDGFGDEKKTYSGVNRRNVTEEMLAATPDEDLRQFAKHALGLDYPEIELADDEEKKLYFAALRQNIRNKIRGLEKARARRSATETKRKQAKGA